MKPIRIAILEDDEELLDYMSRLIHIKSDIVIVDKFHDAESFIADFDKIEIDVALVDIGLPKKSGIDAIRLLKPKKPEVQFLIWSSFDDEEKIFDALEAGATGYILKNSPTEQLIESIKSIYRGGSPMNSSVARKVIASFHRSEVKKSEYNLTSREDEILSLLSKGLRYKECADKLFINIETVRSHIQNIYKKLHVSSRTEALNKIYKNKPI